MNKRVELDKIRLKVLPPKVIKLLAQFTYYLKKHDGTVIRLSSKNVLQEVHDAYLDANFDVLDELYDEIVREMSAYAHTAPSTSKNIHKRGRTLRVIGTN